MTNICCTFFSVEIYIYRLFSCFCRHNKRQKKQDVALLTSMQPLPAKRRVPTQQLPVPISLASRQPVQPATVMTIQFAPNTAGQAEFWKEGSTTKRRSLPSIATCSSIKISRTGSGTGEEHPMNASIVINRKLKIMDISSRNEVNGTAQSFHYLLKNGRLRMVFNLLIYML